MLRIMLNLPFRRTEKASSLHTVPFVVTENAKLWLDSAAASTAADRGKVEERLTAIEMDAEFFRMRQSLGRMSTSFFAKLG